MKKYFSYIKNTKYKCNENTKITALTLDLCSGKFLVTLMASSLKPKKKRNTIISVQER